MAEQTGSDFGKNWQFRLFGGLTILHDGIPVDVPPYRAQSLLAALLLFPRPLSRVFLCGLLFPDQPEECGRRRINDHLWLLRKALPNLPLESADGCVHLPREHCWLDVAAFKEAIDQYGPTAWQMAFDLYRGDLLPDHYDDWLLVERENLLLVFTGLTSRLADWCLENRDARGAIHCLERLLQIEPLNESAVYKLMQTQASIGNRGAALSVFDRFISLCSQERLQPNPALESYADSLLFSYQPVRLQNLVRGSDLEGESLLQDAQDALQRGDCWSVRDCLKKLKEEPGAYEPLQASLLEIDLAFKFGNPDQGEKLLHQLDPLMLPVKLRMAQFASENQDPAIACELAAEIIEHSQTLGDQHLLMQALLILARAQMRLGETPQAMMSIEKVISLGTQHAMPDQVLSAQILQGRMLIRQGYLERALTSLQSAYQLANRINLPSQAASALHNIGSIQYMSGNVSQALEHCRQELEIWRNLGAHAQEVAALHMLSILESQLGQHQNAIRLLEDAQKILVALGDPIRAARNLYHLASTIACQDGSGVPKAILLTEQALQVFEASQQTGWQAATLEILGYCLWLQNKNAEALQKYEAAYEMHNHLGELAILPENLAYQALALLGMGQNEEALKRSKQALFQLAGLTLENDLISEIYYAHAEVLYSLDDLAGARQYFSMAYQNLLKYAQPLRDEEARRAFFERDPTLRRLMRRVYALGLVDSPEGGLVARRLPARININTAQVDVQVLLDAGPADQALKQAQGSIALRRARLKRIRHEAALQGAAPTVKELAALLGISPRTVKRDLALLRKQESR